MRAGMGWICIRGSSFRQGSANGDTVIAYPGQVTRIRAQFKDAGQFVWHCHIVEHEDNEMMRPFRVGPEQPGRPPDGGGGHGM